MKRLLATLAVLLSTLSVQAADLSITDFSFTTGSDRICGVVNSTQTGVCGGFTTSNLPEGINLYSTNARSIAATLTGYSSGAGTISASDSILQAIQKLNGNIGALTTGVSSIFGRTGAVTAQSGDYNTSLVTENTNLYYTNARGINSILTGYTSGAGTITSADSILQAIQKLNGNIALVPGTVTSVALALPNIFTVSGSPVTSAGTLTGTLATQTANKVFAGPTTGSAAAPTFRSLVAADFPSGVFVPYTGAVSDVNLGNNAIRSGQFGNMTEEQQPFYDANPVSGFGSYIGNEAVDVSTVGFYNGNDQGIATYNYDTNIYTLGNSVIKTDNGEQGAASIGSGGGPSTANATPLTLYNKDPSVLGVNFVVTDEGLTAGYPANIGSLGFSADGAWVKAGVTDSEWGRIPYIDGSATYPSLKYPTGSQIFLSSDDPHIFGISDASQAFGMYADIANDFSGTEYGFYSLTDGSTLFARDEGTHKFLYADRSWYLNNSFNNIGIGGCSSITTGTNDLCLGSGSGNNLTDANRSIIIGTGIDAPSANSDGQLDIGNIIFGTGVNGTGSTISGNIGIGLINPTTRFQILAGSTSIAPFGLTSGALKTSPTVGAIEFLTDKLYSTITTGTARKEITLNDAALTSGKIPQITTNGRLTDSTGTGYVKTSSGTVSYQATPIPVADGGTGQTTLVGAGIPQVVASADLTGQTTAVATVTSTTVPNDGSSHQYDIGGYITVTAVTASTATMAVDYTDETSTSRTATFFGEGLTTAAISATGISSFPALRIRAKQNTTITVKTTITGVAITYDVGASIMRIN